jgi:hypothetical protein
MSEETLAAPAAETPETTNANEAPSEVQAPEPKPSDTIDTDVFAWANNLVRFKDEMKVDLFLINKNYVVYKTTLGKELGKQLEPIFIDEILEYVLEGAAEGLVVRGFEKAEAEENVLQRTKLDNVDRLKEVLNWVKHQQNEMEMFVEEEHDIKRIKGVMARVSHDELDKPFYIFKVLPQSQVMKGSQGWMIRGGKFVGFDADAAIRIPSDPQLLLLDQDLYVFNQTKLKQLFGYDAKEASIARQKVEEIEANFKLSFDEGNDMQTLVKDKKAIIKKLQKINPYAVKQEELMSHAEELDIDLMEDESGNIIIMDDKDLAKFVNLLNDDYIESPLTGERYEIIKKKPLKIRSSEDDLLKEVL